MVGPCSGAAFLNKTTGSTISTDSSYITGNVRASISDGAGGFFIGGNFTKVGSVNRKGFAHINADGTLDTTISADVTGTVLSLKLHNNIVYIGGDFTAIAGTQIHYLAAFDLTTKSVTSWNPKLGNSVSSIDANGANLVIGGAYETVNVVAYGHVIPINFDGTVTSTFPTANGITNGEIMDFTSDGAGGLYVGGSFTEIGGYPIKYLAHLNADMSVDTTFDMNVVGYVFQVNKVGTRLIMSGGFQTVAGLTRWGVAGIDLTSKTVLPWSVDLVTGPGWATYGRQLFIDGNVAFVTGMFHTAGGVARNTVVAFDIITGALYGFNPASNHTNEYFSIFASGTTVYLSGNFTLIGGQARNRLAAIDFTTSLAMAWDPNPDAFVYDMISNGTKLFLSGDFNTIATLPRTGLASFDLVSGVIEAWDPGLGFENGNLALQGTSLYIAGRLDVAGTIKKKLVEVDTGTGALGTINYFSSGTEVGGGVKVVNGKLYFYAGQSIGGNSQRYLAQINQTTAVATAWAPEPGADVDTMSVSGSKVYVGGKFTNIGGQARNYIAELDLTTGLATAWDPNSNSYVRVIHQVAGRIFVGGNITTIGGGARALLAELSPTTGLLTTWNPNITIGNDVYGLSDDGTQLFIAGAFEEFNGTTKRFRAASVNLSDASLTSWESHSAAVQYAVSVGTNFIFIGGDDKLTGGMLRSNLAAFDITTSQINSWNPNADATVYTVLTATDTIYVGGDFTTIGAVLRNFGAALDPTTAAVKAWDPNADSTILTIKKSGSTLFLGGFFSMMGGQVRNALATVDAASGALFAWDPDLSGGASVYDLLISNNQLYVGGSFSTAAGGVPRSGGAAFNISDNSLAAWDPNTNNSVYSLYPHNGYILLGGDFNLVGGNAKARLAATNASTGAFVSWGPTIDNNEVKKITASSDSVYISGSFTSVDSQTQKLIVALDATTSVVKPWNLITSTYLYASIESMYVVSDVIFVGGYDLSQAGTSLKSFDYLIAP